MVSATVLLTPFFDTILRGFLGANASSERGECYIPTTVAALVASGEATVRVLPTDALWFGVTYREDRPRVVESLQELVGAGAYPEKL
jgi:hypothetical protein